MDKLVAAMKADGIPGEIYYRQNEIPLGSTGNNFCWFNPRKTAGYCRVLVKLSADSRDSVLAELQERGIDASSRGSRSLAFSITTKQLDEHLPIILKVLKQAEELSK
jgi:hypothetical protein